MLDKHYDFALSTSIFKSLIIYFETMHSIFFAIFVICEYCIYITSTLLTPQNFPVPS